MSKFVVPYANNEKYVNFINSIDEIETVYYSLSKSSSARTPGAYQSFGDLNTELLSKVGKKKALLFNSNFYLISEYYENDDIIKTIIEYKEKGLIDEVIVHDMYFVKGIIQKYDDFRNFDLIPSSNIHIDTVDKLNSYLDFCYRFKIKFPYKVIIDRRLNRDKKGLEELKKYIDVNNLNIKLETLVNEGCIINCPYKTQHDNHIAMANFTNYNPIMRETLTVLYKNVDRNINLTLGCSKDYSEHPDLILESPFIRPEDLYFYKDYIDYFKISGRGLPIGALMNIINAYLEEHYGGNLLEILDTTYGLSIYAYLDNTRIDSTFVETVTTCNKDCFKCKYCNDVARDAFFTKDKSKVVSAREFEE